MKNSLSNPFICPPFSRLSMMKELYGKSYNCMFLLQPCPHVQEE